MQEDWETAEAERQELLRKMRSEAAAAAEQQERAALQVRTAPILDLIPQLSCAQQAGSVCNHQQFSQPFPLPNSGKQAQQ